MSIVEINPDRIYFTFSRIKPWYSCGRAIEDTLQQIRDKEIQANQLPQITLLTDGTNFFSLNNRRLYTFKQLKKEGVISTIKARVKQIPKTKRMENKYTKEKCSLTATLMRVKEKQGGINEVADSEEDEPEEDRIEDIEAEEEKARQEEEEAARKQEEEKPRIHGALKQEGVPTVEKRQAVSFGEAKDNTVVMVERKEKEETSIEGEDVTPKQPRIVTEKMLRGLRKEKKDKPHLRMSDGKKKAKKKNAKWQQQLDTTRAASHDPSKSMKPSTHQESKGAEESDEDEEEEASSSSEESVEAPRAGFSAGFGALKKRR